MACWCELDQLALGGGGGHAMDHPNPATILICPAVRLQSLSPQGGSYGGIDSAACKFAW